MDYPDPAGGRKRHDQVTPLVGGLLSLPPVIAMAVYMALYGDGISPPGVTLLTWSSFGAAGLLLIGYLDDRIELAPTGRLLMTIAIYTVVVAAVPNLRLEYLYFGFMDRALFISTWGGVFSVLCLVGLSNAVNMADGKNGLVIGLSIIWTALLSAYLPPAFWPLTAISIIALLIALFFNLRGKLFLGDAGSYGWSCFIGLFAIGVYADNFARLPAEQMALWFLIPVVDCLRLMVSRILSGRSPFSGDREHLHHYIALAMDWRFGLAFYLALVAVPNILAILMPELTLYWAGISLVVYTLVIAASFRQRSLRNATS